MFKQTSPWDTPAKQRVDTEVKCPQCGILMHNMGHDFKTPKQNNVKQWKKVQILFEHGEAYHSCGCGEPGYRPTKLQEVDSFLAENLPKSSGQKLLERISQKIAYR